MSIPISHFESLIQRFPTWADLRPHLESPAGGGLRVVEQGDSPLVILRYVKGQSNLAAAELGLELFRSVVWDTAANRPVCVAPPKAREGLPPLGTQLAATEDFVDGFMMNVFVQKSTAAGTGEAPILTVATRTQLGGANTFYSAKSFGALLDEALATTPFRNRAALAVALDGFRGDAEAAFCSLVVQHPEHRIVAKPPAPALTVVHLGTVETSGVVQLRERATNWPQAFMRLQPPSYALRLFRSEQEIQDLLRKQAVERGWRWQGLVFKDGTGARWRLRTSTYSLLRELRGSEAAPVDRFLRLRSTGKVVEYLKHYNEERQRFWDYEQALRARTADVLAAYCDVHKAHKVAFKNLPLEYRPAVFRLHSLWRDTLRPKGYTVRIQNAIAAVNELRPFEQRRLLEAPVYATPAQAADTQDNQEGQGEPTDMEVEEQPVADSAAQD